MKDRPTITYIEEPAVPRPAIAYIGEALPSTEPASPAVGEVPIPERRGKKSTATPPTDEPLDPHS